MLKGLIKIIHELRHVFLLLIVFGFFVVVGLNPISVSHFLGAKFSRSVGLSVSVPENPFNKLALDLKEKENELVRREAELNRKERIAVDTGSPFFDQKNLILLLLAGIVILFILLAVNFYLDYRRRIIKN